MHSDAGSSSVCASRFFPASAPLGLTICQRHYPIVGRNRRNEHRRCDIMPTLVLICSTSPHEGIPPQPGGKPELRTARRRLLTILRLGNNAARGPAPRCPKSPDRMLLRLRLAACRERPVAQHPKIFSYDATPAAKSDRLLARINLARVLTGVYELARHKCPLAPACPGRCSTFPPITHHRSLAPSSGIWPLAFASGTTGCLGFPVAPSHCPHSPKIQFPINPRPKTRFWP